MLEPRSLIRASYHRSTPMPEHPTKQRIDEAIYALRSFIVSEKRAQEIMSRFPNSEILREVQIWEELPGVTVLDRQKMSINERRACAQRADGDGQERIYKNMTDIDLLVHRPQDGGLRKFVRFEQQKTGGMDTPGDAKAQNDVAIGKIRAAYGGGPRIRMEIEGRINITDQFDLSSVDTADQITVGPIGKSFDESLEITSGDLDRLVKDLVQKVVKERAQ